MLADHPTYTILLSTDLDASRHFYHEVLGLEILPEDLGEGVEERIVFKTTNGIADLGYSCAAWFIDPSQNCLAVVQPKE